MLVAAVFVCTFLLQRQARQKNLDSNIFFDLVFWIAVNGIIGSRIFFILLNGQYFLDNPSEMIMLQKCGLAWQGGLLFGVLTGIFLIKKKKLDVWKTLDILAPYAALGQAIGRIGCFLNGCCYGKEVSWGIYFPVHHARLHPTQLYDSLGLLVIFFLLKKFDAYKRGSGEVFILYLLLASFDRFVVEFFRADHTALFLSLSIFQLVSLFIIAGASYAYLFLRSRRGK